MQGWRTDMVRRWRECACHQSLHPSLRGAISPLPPFTHPPLPLPSPPSSQEDAHAAVLDLPEGGPRSALFAVLDGHGGAEVARFVAAHVVSEGSSGGLYGLYAGGQQRGAGQVGGWVQSGGCMVSMAHRTAVL